MKLYLSLFVLSLFYSCTSTSKKVKNELVLKQELYEVNFPELPKKEALFYKDSILEFYKKHIAYRAWHGHFLVAKNGQIIFERYSGIVNHKKNIAMSHDVPIHVASISKVITSVAILRLVDSKKIDLYQTVSHYLPNFKFSNIRIIDLLSHRSGLPYYGYFPEKTFKNSVWVKNQDLIFLLNESGIIPYCSPNRFFSYCNTNFALLALIVEKVTQKSFPDWVKEDIFLTLKMHNSFIFSGDTLNLPVARSYTSKGKLLPWDKFDGVYGDKNVYTTAKDLFLFSSGLFSDAFLSVKSKKLMFKGYSYEKPGKSNYGLGMRMREEKGKEDFFFHTGWWHGYTGCFVHLPKDTVTMVAISNHYDRNMYGINVLSLIFGNYPFSPLTDPNENYVSENQQKKYLKKAVKVKFPLALQN